ncbi:MAG: ABC-2 type transport system ATP-binding protein [Candidatus Magnetoglobus multicellularis str. Araruama]|uniref:ABC-2 type transport system ATP-binding protein n=1 Tax=Candidatus Magnetoglobus multicellularis str. Araruama TaxID=890399 RepID=A0A1V1PD65_9BACT|nr:MAG: ABC-2 type transport system ATP-binding protein [Candidatus Magnetoglobus multicellularis str. Araruama]
MESKAIIQTSDLTKLYGKQAAVDHLTFSVYEGEIFGFLGPNGAGKTTTLLMLMGLTEPTAGSADVMGINPTRDPINVKRHIGYLQENMGFYRELDAFQTLKFITDLNEIPDDIANERIQSAIKTVGLENAGNKVISAYSRGMRQRLGIAEVLVKSPKIAFLDEPTLGLDPDTTNKIIDLIQWLSKEKKMSILLSSHLLYQVQRICDRVGIMINGKLVACGDMDQLAEEKLGVGKESYTLEALYMKYFQEE